MAVGLTAMNGLYGNSYGMQNYYNNPYFLQAYNSPNYNQFMQTQQPTYQQQSVANTAGQVNTQGGVQATSGTNVNFKGAQSQITNDAKEEKKGSNGLAWLFGIGATVIGTCWWLASRGKARNATGLWNQIKLGAISLFKDSKILKGADIAKHKDALKLKETLKWTDDAANLKRFNFELKDADGTIQKFAYNKGQIANKAYKENKLSETLKNQVDEIVETIKRKDLSKLSADVTVKDIQYTANLKNGVGLYRAVTPDASNNLQLVKAYL